MQTRLHDLLSHFVTRDMFGLNCGFDPQIIADLRAYPGVGWAKHIGEFPRSFVGVSFLHAFFDFVHCWSVFLCISSVPVCSALHF